MFLLCNRNIVVKLCLHKYLSMFPYLALLYYTQGKYAEAESLFKQALTIREKNYGKNHRLVTTVLSNYADVLDKLGKTKEAASMRRRLKRIRAGLD